MRWFECICIASFPLCRFISLPRCNWTGSSLCMYWCVYEHVCVYEHQFCMRACECMCECVRIVNACLCMRERQLNLLNSIEFINKILFRFIFCYVRTQDALKSMQTFNYGINNRILLFLSCHSFDGFAHGKLTQSFLIENHVFPMCWFNFCSNII